MNSARGVRLRAQAANISSTVKKESGQIVKTIKQKVGVAVIFGFDAEMRMRLYFDFVSCISRSNPVEPSSLRGGFGQKVNRVRAPCFIAVACTHESEVACQATHKSGLFHSQFSKASNSFG